MTTAFVETSERVRRLNDLHLVDPKDTLAVRNAKLRT